MSKPTCELCGKGSRAGLKKFPAEYLDENDEVQVHEGYYEYFHTKCLEDEKEAQLEALSEELEPDLWDEISQLG